MSQKLWVQHITTAKTFIDKISIEGCEDIADFLKEIKKEFEILGPSSALTLYQLKDGQEVEIKVGDSPIKYLEGNTDGNSLIVRSTLIEKGILIYEGQAT